MCSRVVLHAAENASKLNYKSRPRDGEDCPYPSEILQVTPYSEDLVVCFLWNGRIRRRVVLGFRGPGAGLLIIKRFVQELLDLESCKKNVQRL